MTIVSHSDSSAPLVVVTGATGAQGGSVVAALKASARPYRIRGLTRDASKPAAVALAEQGVDVLAVNIVVDNKEAVFDAYKGAEIAFLMTDFWKHYDKAREEAEGKLQVDAAKAGGAKRVIWSSLPSISAATDGRFPKVDYAEGKAAVATYAESVLPAEALVCIIPALFMENFFTFRDLLFPTAANTEGVYELATPLPADFVLPWLDAASDFGLFVQVAIEQPAAVSNGVLCAIGDHISFSAFAAMLSQVTGKNTLEYKQVYNDAYKARIASKLPEPVVLMFRDMWHSMLEVGWFCGQPPTSHSLLARKPLTLKEFFAPRLDAHSLLP